jgi:hypothetical protein
LATGRVRNFNLRFVVDRAKPCDADAILIASRRESPMRLVLPYLGIVLCASLAAWMSILLLY